MTVYQDPRKLKKFILMSVAKVARQAQFALIRQL
jgi:hypothetical protein